VSDRTVDRECPRCLQDYRFTLGRDRHTPVVDRLDAQSLSRAFDGAYGVYGVTTPLTPRGKIDTEQERRQHGFNIADACVVAGIQHLVLSTVLYINVDQLAVPYVRSKQAVEEYVIASGTPFTFLRPAPFMDEIGGEFLPVKKGVLTGQIASVVGAKAL
jgi:uncharacterized protein YbjT (DUF2867 family)